MDLKTSPDKKQKPIPLINISNCTEQNDEDGKYNCYPCINIALK